MDGYLHLELVSLLDSYDAEYVAYGGVQGVGLHLIVAVAHGVL